jgi:hypothetical protein
MFGFLFLAFVGLLAFLLIRAGAKPGIVVFILVGIFVPLSIALAAWFLASPPIWTLFAQRAEALVQVADIVEPRDGPPAVGVALTSSMCACAWPMNAPAGCWRFMASNRPMALFQAVWKPRMPCAMPIR